MSFDDTLDAGELNTHIYILKKDYSDETDNNGFPIIQWNKWNGRWVKKTGLSGRTFYAAAATQSESDVIFETRYIKGITPDMRIGENPHIVNGDLVFDNTYEIKADPVDKTGLKRKLYITCSKVTSK